MECDKLVSIIIPVYNVQTYLRECLDSILQQTYKNFEVILVDDGSNDDSPNLCEEYAQKDSRFIAIHKENGGVASARNKGLQVAKGEYITFVDSDDTIDSNYIEAMVSGMERYKVDFVRAPFKKNGVPQFNYSYYASLDNPVIEFYSMINTSLFNSVWGMMLKRNCIGDICFDESIFYGEDVLFLLQVFVNSENKELLLLKGPFYNYAVREGSALNTSFNVKWLSLLTVADKVEDLLRPFPFMDCPAKKFKKFCCLTVYEKLVDCKESRYAEKKKVLREEIIKLRKQGFRPKNKIADIMELSVIYGGYGIIRNLRKIKSRLFA